MIRIHTVKPGERLADLALQYYGDPRLGGPIYQHNRQQIENPNQLSIGQRLVIPYIKVR